MAPGTERIGRFLVLVFGFFLVCLFFGFFQTLSDFHDLGQGRTVKIANSVDSAPGWPLLAAGSVPSPRWGSTAPTPRILFKASRR